MLFLPGCEHYDDALASLLRAPRSPAARRASHALCRGSKCWKTALVPSGFQQINLVSYQPGVAHFTDPNLNGWGMTSMPDGSFCRGQHVHHRAGHVLRPLRPRAAADDHRAGVGGRVGGPGARAGRPPHRRRLQPDVGLRDLGRRQVRPGHPDLRFDRRHHQRLEPRRRSNPCDPHTGHLEARRHRLRLTPGWRSGRTARGRSMSCMRPTSSTTNWR